MRTKTLLLTALTALAAVAVLAGCASMHTAFNPARYEGCDEQANPAHVCRVKVTVSACGAGTVSADPDPRHIPANGTWVIQWTLASPGYEFADDGIEFKSPGAIFTKRGKAGAATFVWVDRNTDAAATGRHKYNVHILRNGAECAKYDPEVSND